MEKYPNPPDSNACESAHDWFLCAVKMSERIADLRAALGLIWIEQGTATFQAEIAIKKDNQRRDNGC